MKETKELAVKEELEEEIFQLEEASRGWFEDDEDFQGRVCAIRFKGANTGFVGRHDLTLEAYYSHCMMEQGGRKSLLTRSSRGWKDWR